MEGNWISVEEFAKALDIDEVDVYHMIKKGSAETYEEDGTLYVRSSAASNVLTPDVIIENDSDGEQKEDNKGSENHLVGTQFVEKTIGTIMNLHEKVIDAKDETIVVLKDENAFMKEALYSMQELYDEDRKTIETLTEQLKLCQEETLFMKRKYKMMWGKVVENYTD